MVNLGWSNFYEGQIVNYWTIIARDSSKKRMRYYLVKCVCSKIRSVRGSCLQRGTSKSCGCITTQKKLEYYTKIRTGNKARTRGTLEFFKTQTWGNLNKRTVNGSKFNEKHKSYRRKNIQLLITKQQFYDWCDSQKQIIIDLYKKGDTPSVDRIDNNGHYEISNMQILPHKENVSKDKSKGIIK